ncbi:MAG: hypothetical protein Q7J15_04145, partial [Candidatus Desulfaltia sp.]|nr:hypothetical protein [Candidatus Desulfaltia sp.]
KQDTITAITLSADETAVEYFILDSGNGLFTAGFRPGDTITISGFTGVLANNQITTVTKVWSDGSKMQIAGTLVDDLAGESVTITSCAKTFKDIFRNGVIRVYSGTEPADADADEGAGTLLLEITKDSGALIPGISTNGLNFDAIVSGKLSKNTDVWSDAGLAAGTASWYRMYDNGRVTGSSSEAKRCQGRISTSGTTFILSSTSIKLGATTTVDTADFTMPAN